ncbi:npl p60-family secreted protein [Streptomyces xiamenensis]|uniref:Npl p60-family secreted protein n=1 Tax=Streptomyces xiamenensis TaxID=408015 RepID=A0A0F7FR03_9ACTN|nr:MULTISPECIES: C40 family peptidase [Streptomyces]AKG42455.1 npl p60-family secreted protein [Streptomyces xiamenensis]
MATHRRPPQHGPARAARASVLSAAASAAVALSSAPAVAEPVPSSAGAAERVDRLFAEAERAVEAYNGTSERVEELTAEAELYQRRVETGRQAVNETRRSLGSAAAAHYRAGGIDPTVTLMLSDDPDSYLARAATLNRVSTRRSGELRELQAAQRTLEQRRAEAGDKLDELAAEREVLAREKRTVLRKLATAQAQYDRLTAREQADREAREQAAATTAPTAATATPASEPSATGRGATALAAAHSALGSPYAWGAAGPNSFDCSGLTQWAYRQAGISLPRTSQAQAAAGTAVPLSAAQPGDLVVYRGDASHIALYVGGGQVIHAPYPGAQVRMEPVGMMPLHSVVRP